MAAGISRRSCVTLRPFGRVHSCLGFMLYEPLPLPLRNAKTICPVLLVHSVGPTVLA